MIGLGIFDISTHPGSESVRETVQQHFPSTQIVTQYYSLGHTVIIVLTKNIGIIPHINQI